MMRAMSDTIKRILGDTAPREIVESVVEWVAVQVPTFLSLAAQTNERLKH